jgi:uracil-DNA glycosylase
MSKKVKIVIKPEIKEDWTIAEIVRNSPPLPWKEFFEKNYDILNEISEVLENEEFYPLKKDLFKVFELISPKQVKVVVIGQDPYPSTSLIDSKILPTATGIAFSVRDDDEIPSSLQNIFKELCSGKEYNLKDLSGDLTSWVTQGVLLLNSSLTVKPGKAGYFKAVWFPFIAEVIKYLQRLNKKIIYVFWGQTAKKYLAKYIEHGEILSAAHPSGRSANNGFLGCKHFEEINQILAARGDQEINWLSILKRSQ